MSNKEEKNNYNKQYKKWVKGDTFALKIKDNRDYKDKYLLFIKYDNPSWDIDKNVFSFRAKITNDNYLPSNKEQIDNLEYIQTSHTFYCKRFFPFSGLISNEELIKERSKVKFYPDENGYLDIYIFNICFQRKNLFYLDDFIYLGNFDLLEPNHEYVPFHKYNRTEFNFLSTLEERLLKCYEDYNLKKSPIYSKEILSMIEPWGTEVPPSKEEIEAILKEKNISFDDEEIVEDSLTYVGGEEEDPYENKNNN